MEWTEFTVRTTTAGAEIASEIMMEAGASGTLVEDKHDFVMGLQPSDRWDLVDPELLTNMSEDVLVKAYFPSDDRLERTYAYLQERLAQVRALELPFDIEPLTLNRQGVHEQDWAENWKQYYKPFRAGKSLVVKPTWESYQALEGDRVIEMDPGMAFGTGTHETTQLCMELIEKYAGEKDNVLDIGTGTGILAIAAAYLGASHADAIDLDPVAVRVARENVRHNGVDNVVFPQEGDLLRDVQGQYDLVISNIIADVIILLSGHVSEFMAPHGVWISSGIIRDREEDVLGALSKQGFEVREIVRRGEWIAIAAARKEQK